MDIKTISQDLSVSPQVRPDDIALAVAQGFKSIIINRPDGEDSNQPSHAAIEEAGKAHGLEVRYVPVVPGNLTDADVSAFRKALRELPAPALAYCRTGTRSVTLWALSQAGHLSTEAILGTASGAGYDLAALTPRLETGAHSAANDSRAVVTHDIVIIGGGAAGLATAGSLLKRRKGLDIAIVEPSTEHYYQPGWTLVGGGVFSQKRTEKQMARLMPKGAQWIRSACAGFDPEQSEIILEDGERIGYKTLVVAPGLKLDWDQIDGLRETLGKNGVTSNYMRGLGKYTWELVQNMTSGKALFTQPPMPIKCAGAPQKAMYLSCSAWRKSGALSSIDVSFHNAGGVLFGVKEYVPALMKYVDRYGIDLKFKERLIAVDGPAKRAVFEMTDEAGLTNTVTREFDMLHVCPPQVAPDFVASSPLANEAGWVDVDQNTLQHVRYQNVFSVGDAAGTPNAKTAAAIRKQAPVAAVNILRTLDSRAPNAAYNGYGSCPLTVERGRVVLAEFSYGGKLDPSFPNWLLNGTRPTLKGWIAKAVLMPTLYFDFMLKGREWLANPKIIPNVSDAKIQDRSAESDPTKRAA